MQKNAKKQFIGNLDMDHVSKMVSDEVAEFFTPLENIKKTVIVDKKIDDSKWPKDPKFYSNLMMQLVDGLMDAEYYILQHLSTNVRDGDHFLSICCNTHTSIASMIVYNNVLDMFSKENTAYSIITGIIEQINENRIVHDKPDKKYLDFYEENEVLFYDAVKTGKNCSDLWNRGVFTTFTNPDYYYKLCIQCLTIVDNLTDMLSFLDYKEKPDLDAHTNKDEDEYDKDEDKYEKIIALCSLANIVAQLIFWFCTIPVKDSEPIFIPTRKIWNLIHDANMKKFGPGGRLEGKKWIKPDDFKAPDDDIQKVIEETVDDDTIIRHVKNIAMAYFHVQIYSATANKIKKINEKNAPANTETQTHTNQSEK